MSTTNTTTTDTTVPLGSRPTRGRAAKTALGVAAVAGACWLTAAPWVWWS